MVCAHALGAMGPLLLSLALLLGAAVSFALAGMTPFTSALVGALIVLTASQWFGVDLFVALRPFIP